MSKEIARGAGWMVLFKIAERSLGLISTIILARLLVPADFGLVAMAISVIAMVEIATAFSFDVMLIHRKAPSQELYNSAWTLNILLGATCAGLSAALAVPAAAFFNEPRLVAVLLWLALGWLAQGFENIGIVEFRRSMDFAQEFRILVGKKVVGFVVTVALAIWLESYWALVAGTVASKISGVVLSYAMHPYRPRPSLGAARELFTFSVWLLLNNVLVFATTRLSHFLIGRALGPTPLGLYTVGSEVANLPTTELVSTINRAVFPGLARMSNDVEGMRKTYLDVTGVIAAFSFPAAAGLAAVATPVVTLVLGTKWLDAVPVIRILAVAGAITVLSSHNHSAYLALGKSATTTFIMTARTIALILGLVVLTQPYGLQGIAYAELISVIVMLLCSGPLLFPALKVTLSGYLAKILRPAVAAAEHLHRMEVQRRLRERRAQEAAARYTHE